ncbi:MAG TPA: caspase family protein [Kribbella sp.]
MVIGVSEYPFADGPNASAWGQRFGLENLSSAARSASDVAAWLLKEYSNPDAELASLRVLLSPSAGEVINPEIAPFAPAAATRKAVASELKAFRDSCGENPDNVGFVYIAGHGIQLTKRGAVVLLHDFGDPAGENELSGAIDVVGCHGGMDEARAARNQIWFSDACRQEPEVAKLFERLEGALTLSEGVGTVQASPLFLASSTRENAFAHVGGTSVFSQALLWALRGNAAVGPDEFSPVWHVGTTQLIRALPRRVNAILGEHGAEQQVDVQGKPLEVVAQQLAKPPELDIEVELEPNDIRPAPTAELLFNATEPVPVQQAWPLRLRGPAGLYLLLAAVQPPLTGGQRRKILDVVPPGCTDVLRIS